MRLKGTGRGQHVNSIIHTYAGHLRDRPLVGTKFASRSDVFWLGKGPTLVGLESWGMLGHLNTPSQLKGMFYIFQLSYLGPRRNVSYQTTNQRDS